MLSVDYVSSISLTSQRTISDSDTIRLKALNVIMLITFYRHLRINYIYRIKTLRML